MKFPETYAALRKNHFKEGAFSLIPIRYEDRGSIMQWRNEQMFHLRQSQPLTAAAQERYFSEVVHPLFEAEQPPQLLFSFFEHDELAGYGGLVHIDWINRNAEISFVMNTGSEASHFEIYWRAYLQLLEVIAFEEAGLHKIFTYAYDLRPHLYTVLEKGGFEREAVLKDHCYFDGAFRNVLIHSKIKPLLS